MTEDNSGTLIIGPWNIAEEFSVYFEKCLNR